MSARTDVYCKTAYTLGDLEYENGQVTVRKVAEPVIHPLDSTPVKDSSKPKSKPSILYSKYFHQISKNIIPKTYFFGIHSLEKSKESSGKIPTIIKVINALNALAILPFFSPIIALVRIGLIIHISKKAMRKDNINEVFLVRPVKFSAIKILPELVGCGFLLTIPDLIITALRGCVEKIEGLRNR